MMCRSGTELLPLPSGATHVAVEATDETRFGVG